MTYEPKNEHWRTLEFKERVTRKQAQDILLYHPIIIYAGKVYELKAKHIGAGIYEIYKEIPKK